METTNLEALPTELLIEIFRYVPNRWNLSLVCWNFYEIVCEIEKEKFILKLIDVSCTISCNSNHSDEFYFSLKMRRNSSRLSTQNGSSTV